MSAAEPRNVAALRPNGSAAPTTNSHAPSGGAPRLLPTICTAIRRALARGSLSAETTDGSSVIDALSASISPMPRQKNAAYTTAMPTASRHTITASAPTTTARSRLTTTMRRRRSSRSTYAPPMSENNSHGSCWMNTAPATSAGSSVSDATSSGPAASATPSPTLDTALAAHSFANPGCPNVKNRTARRVAGSCACPIAGTLTAPHPSRH